MLRNHVEIESFYLEQFDEHGTTPRGMAWADAGEHYVRTVQALRLSNLFAKPGRRILEVGCGFGYLPYIWDSQGQHLSSYTGIDLVQAYIDAARDRMGYSSSQCVFICEPFEEFQWIDPYDLTIAIGVIAWQPSAKAQEILFRLWEATKVGGWMLFTYLPNHPLAPQEINMLRTRLSVDVWVEYSGYAKSKERMIMFRKEEVKNDADRQDDSVV